MRPIKLAPDERVLIESPVNRYAVLGPGRVWIKPLQRIITHFQVGLRSELITIEGVRTVEHMPLSFKIQLLYRPDPNIFSDELLIKLPGLHKGGWSWALSWHTEYITRLLVAPLSWEAISQEQRQKRLERQLQLALSDRLSRIGLRIISLAVINIRLPGKLQKALVDVESRAKVLEKYRAIFGDNLIRAMPYVIQWELLSILQKNRSHILLNTTGQSYDEWPVAFLSGSKQESLYQAQLPV
jgi:hypothetical protein